MQFSLRLLIRDVRVLGLGLLNMILTNPKLNKMCPRNTACRINRGLLPLFSRGLPVKNGRRIAGAARPLTSNHLLWVSLHSFRPAKERGDLAGWYPMMLSRELSERVKTQFAQQRRPVVQHPKHLHS